MIISMGSPTQNQVTQKYPPHRQLQSASSTEIILPPTTPCNPPPSRTRIVTTDFPIHQHTACTTLIHTTINTTYSYFFKPTNTPQNLLGSFLSGIGTIFPSSDIIFLWC